MKPRDHAPPEPDLNGAFQAPFICSPPLFAPVKRANGAHSAVFGAGSLWCKGG
jgi:hypothetical protein